MFRRKWLIISRFLRNILPPLALRRLIPVANFHDSTWRLSSIPDVFKGISNTTYTYDATNQLTHDGTTTYSYDLNGNRTMPGYTTGTGNRLSSDGTWTFSYDDEGNLTGKTKGAGLETWAYTYDHENHLKSVRQTSNGTTDVLRVTYSYDSLGQRVQEDKWKTGVGSATARFVYDGDDVWADLDGTNTLQTRYLRGDNVDEVFARIKSTGAAGWYLTDRMGSVRDVTDASGTVVDHLDYSGFGVVTESNTSAGDRYKWTGREYDGDTGLQYNRARYFDGGVGRWTSEDPIGFEAGDFNISRYLGNNSVNGIDPFGLEWQWRRYDLFQIIPLFGTLGVLGKESVDWLVEWDRERKIDDKIAEYKQNKNDIIASTDAMVNKGNVSTYTGLKAADPAMDQRWNRGMNDSIIITKIGEVGQSIAPNLATVPGIGMSPKGMPSPGAPRPVSNLGGNPELGALIRQVSGNRTLTAAQKAAQLAEGAGRIPGVTFERIPGVPGVEAVFRGVGEKAPLLVVTREGQVLRGYAAEALIRDPAGSGGWRIVINRLSEVPQ